jgi:O-antigen/teichoic acid export membrane protein
LINKLKPKSEFSRNVLTLITGTTIAQAIPIAISPILTRIYTPADFGVFALYMSIASIMSVIATGRYELAIMLPKKDEDAINIVALSLMISFFISLVSLMIVFIFNSQITNLLGNHEISNWLYFIPITVLLTGIYQSFNYWSNRKKHYKRLALSRVLQSGTTSSANLGMGYYGFGSSGLILGGVLGQGIAVTMLAKVIWKEDNKLLIYIKKK